MNLLIVEDDTMYAATLCKQLEALDHHVTVVDSGPAALRAVSQERLDAVVLDCMLPQMDGATVVRRLREGGQTLPVLMLSALGRSVEKVDGLDAGADDYVVKPAAIEEIDARLRALVRARQRVAQPADTLRAGDVTVSPARHRAWSANRPLQLTKLEFSLLLELCRNAGSFLTRAMILETVWGYDFEPSTNIVDAQIRSLRRKLTEGGEPDPIVTQRGVGYMLVG